MSGQNPADNESYRAWAFVLFEGEDRWENGCEDRANSRDEIEEKDEQSPEGCKIEASPGHYSVAEKGGGQAGEGFNADVLSRVAVDLLDYFKYFGFLDVAPGHAFYFGAETALLKEEEHNVDTD